MRYYLRRKNFMPIMYKQINDIKKIKVEILRQFNSINIESSLLKTIYYALYKNSFIYIPEQLKSTELVYNIVALGRAITDSISIIVEDSLYDMKHALYSKLSKNIKVISLDKFSIDNESNIYIFDEFSEIKSFSFFRELDSDLFDKKIILCTVNSPVIFLELIRSKTILNFYTPMIENMDKCKFYKNLIEDSNIVNFDTYQKMMKSKQKNSSVTQYIASLKEKERSFFEWLNTNGLYDDKIWIEFYPTAKPLKFFKSDKLIILCKILKILKGSKNCLIVKTEKIGDFIKKILNITNKIGFIETKGSKYEVSIEILAFTEIMRVEKEKYQNIIFFDFYPLNINVTKYILCGDNEKVLFKKFLAAEEIIVNEVFPEISSNFPELDFEGFCNKQKNTNQLLIEDLNIRHAHLLEEDHGYKIKQKQNNFGSKYDEIKIGNETKITESIKTSNFLKNKDNEKTNYDTETMNLIQKKSNGSNHEEIASFVPGISNSIQRNDNYLISDKFVNFRADSKASIQEKHKSINPGIRNTDLFQVDTDSHGLFIDEPLKNEVENNSNHSNISFNGIDKCIYQEIFNNQLNFTILFENRYFKNLTQKLNLISNEIEFKKSYAKISIQTENSLITTFLLSKISESPVIFHPTLTQGFTYCITNSFSLGHLNFYNSFISKFEASGLGFMFFNNDKIIFFYLSKQITLRIEISKQIVEETLFFDLIDDEICLYFPLKSNPNVFILDEFSPLHNEKMRKLQMVEKFTFLDNLEWKRASTNEFSHFEDAYDIKFKINLNYGNRKTPKKETIEPVNSELIKLYKQFQINPDMCEPKSKKCYAENNNHDLYTDERFNTEVKNLCDLRYTIESLLNRLVQYDYRLFFINITQKEKSGKSLKDLRKYFMKYDFQDYYYFEILLTKKDRHIDNKIHNLEIFENLNIKSLVNYLDANITNRFFSVEKYIKHFRNTNFKDKQKNLKKEKNIIRQITITPFKVKCMYPQNYVSNRVLRNYDPDKFIRVSFKDENENLIQKNNERNNYYIYERIKNIMKEGFTIGERKYFFLAMSSSQLKLHSAWFITPYMFNETLIGADYVRTWLGDFKSINNIGKYAIRLGQGLSSTTETIEIKEIKEIDDIERNGYCFSDGIGQIGYDLAHEVIQYLNIKEVPSAFQIRLGGYKGVVSLVWKKSQFSNQEHKVKKIKQVIADITKDLNRNLSEKSLVLRKSMKKYDSDYKFLEVITYSQNFVCSINRQIIIILESRGISRNIFLQMQDKLISRFILSDPAFHIKRYASDFPVKNSLSSERFFLSMLEPVLKRTFENLIKKTKIQICKGRLLMGILDEFDVLDEDEVFIRCSPCLDCVCNNTKIQTITGKVAIAKNPCLHPGDLRIVKAVCKPELLYLKDVVVFSRRGKRPIFNMCSGSDLDGDLYFCTWDENLIPRKQVEPFAYESKTVLYKQIVSLDDIINFYARFMHDNNLGMIANSHLALSDKLEQGVNEEECIRLATLFNLGVDFPKTGFVPRLPDDLEPEAYPDFMQKNCTTYKSNKVLGIMFRRSYMFSELHYYSCECRGKPSKYIRNLYDFRCRNICKILNNKYKKAWYDSKQFSENFTATLEKILNYEKETIDIFNSYREEINMYLIKNGYKNECDAFLGFINENSNERRYDSGIREIAKKYKKIILENVSSKCLPYKILSFYIVANSRCNDYSNSMMWILCDDLSKYETILQGFLTEAKDVIYKNENISIRMFCIEDLTPVIAHSKNNYIDISYNEFDMVNVKHIKFKLCEKIVLVDSTNDFKFLSEVQKSKKYLLFKDFILIPRYLSLYENFQAKISNSENMKELFLLFAAVRFFVLEDIRYLFELFAYLTQIENHENSKSRMCNKLILLSQEFYRKNKSEKMSGNLFEWIYTHDVEEKENRCNIILLVSFIFSLQHTIGSKLITCEDVFFYEKETYGRTKRKNHLYIYKKSFGISINGMFDSSDLVYMKKYEGICLEEHENTKKYKLELLNPGVCSVENYKDDLRKFIFENIYMEKDDLMYIKIRIIPGKFYYYELDTYSSNNNMEITYVVDNTLFANNVNTNQISNYALRSDFVNCHPLLEEENEIYIKNNSLKVYNKELYYVLHIEINNNKYSVYYSYENNLFELTKITKNQIIPGRYIVSQRKDVLFEISSENVIYCKLYNIDTLNDTENVLLKPIITKNNNNEIIFLYHKELKSDKCKTSLEFVKQMNFGTIKTKLISVVLKNDYKLDLNRCIFILEKQSTNAFCCVQEYFKVVNFKTFDYFFENTWGLFNLYFQDE